MPLTDMAHSVLIADDSDTLRGVFCKLFRDYGWTVWEARNGCQAVEMAQNHNPAVIVLDIAMPDMDGIRAARLLMDKMPKVQIVLCSLYATDEMINREIYQAGIQKVLMKSDAYRYLVPIAETLAV